MNTMIEDNQTRLQKLVEEGTRLADQQFGCHYMVNELMAVVLMAKMHDKGFRVSVPDAEACVARMRVAIETGKYPLDMLRASEIGSRGGEGSSGGE